jgi:hypothetical protein
MRPKKPRSKSPCLVHVHRRTLGPPSPRSMLQLSLCILQHNFHVFLLQNSRIRKSADIPFNLCIKISLSHSAFLEVLFCSLHRFLSPDILSFFVFRRDLTMLLRLVSNLWNQAILLPPPPECWDYRRASLGSAS